MIHYDLFSNYINVSFWNSEKKRIKYFAMPMTNKVNRATCNFIQIISKIQFNAESLVADS